MRRLNNVSCADTYTGAATIQDVFDGGGGFFQVLDNDAFAQLAWGALGNWQWSNEFLIDSDANGALAPGTIGIRFRNAVAGSVARVSAALSSHDEPVVVALPG